MKLEEKIKQQQQAEPWLFRHGEEKVKKKKKSRMDIIGQNGNTGEHYEEVEEAMPNERWNWYGEGEDQPVKMGPCSAHARDQQRWEVHELEEAARKRSFYDLKAELVEEGE
jgi:hypothetical protein